MSDSDEDLSLKPLKLTVIGDGTCGKTSLINQFVHGCQTKTYEQTLGVEFYMKHVYLRASKRSIKVQIWDIGGQNLGGLMLDKYLSGSQGVLLVYDVMNLSSFQNIEDWLKVTRSQLIDEKKLHLALVANKCDMESLRVVKVEIHNRFAQVHGLSSHFVSAKTGESVILCFHKIIADILEIHLGKIELEEQAIVSAEIIHNKHESSILLPLPNKTTVCNLQ